MKFIYVMVASLMIVSCKKADSAGVLDDKQASIDSMKMEMVRQKTIDSMKIEMAKQEAEKAAKEKEVTVINNTTPQAAQTPAERKKWSSTAKGAVIGAGVGAATGAIISKKKGEGAIIGGLAGAGVGAGTGAIIDGKKKE
ncbi:YMGG-like glycine zipper-containing protein [Flavobacterium sp. ARAG 55.4]|uniref:YMGG-like glycine zipper-containing protein n=1 Tax=Flavobacterium plantiphilum TaxID=3163297 RepID=A0ABW8XPK0_9FLAO